ncbi:MAG: hypothetical protein IJI41_14915 [Anaerolineaceae bacterium]|nr:hypothetical protein [Anaerolineaceae bacterium]
MSETYYLVNKTKKLEYEMFKAFWEQKLLPHFDEMLEQYAAERAAENPAAETFIRNICDLRYDSTIRSARHFPVSDIVYMQRLGYYSWTTRQFDWDGGGDISVSGTFITNKDELKKVLEAKTDVSICDGYGNLLTFTEFINETKI